MTIEPPHDLEIHRAQKNDVQALNDVLTKTAPYIFALCTTWCRPPLEAADITQESLLRVAKNLNSYRGESAFFTWVYTLTYRTFVDHARKSKRRESIVRMESMDTSHESIANNSSEESDDVSGASEYIARALDMLEPNHRDILILIDVQELSYESAAQQLKVPVGTVRSRVARARQALKKTLTQQGTFSAHGDVLFPEEPQ